MDKKNRPTLLNYILPVIMIAIGVRHYFKHGIDLWAIIPVILGSLALYLALFNYPLLIRVEALIIKGWFPIGQFFTVLLLSVTFFVVFAPVGIFLRLFKKDILHRTIKPDQLSYWLDRDSTLHRDYTQQF